MKRALAAIGAIAIVLVALGGCSDTRARKPVLYLYPERVVSLGVGLSYDGVVSDSYPVAVEGVGADGRALASWSVTAGPDGVLRDAGGRVYPYLFWEGPTGADLSQGSGFVVARDDVVGFLEEKLALLGLDEREAADFITYWAPRMRVNECALVSFDSGAYRHADRLAPDYSSDISFMVRIFQKLSHLVSDLVRASSRQPWAPCATIGSTAAR